MSESGSTTAADDPAAKRREINRRYNTSRKGQKRNKRYEDKHPERALRWEKARNAMRPGGAP